MPSRACFRWAILHGLLFVALKKRAEDLKLVDVGYKEYFDSAVGAFEAARSVLKAGRMHGLVEGIQAETVSQVLAQAGALLQQDTSLLRQ